MTMHDKLANFFDTHTDCDDLEPKEMVYIKSGTIEIYAFSFHEKHGEDVIQVFEYNAKTGKFAGAYKEFYSDLWAYVEDIEQHVLDENNKQIYFYSV